MPRLLLQQVEDTSFAELKREYRAKGKVQKTERQAANQVQLTETIHEALRLSAVETHDSSIQANLQFIADAFIKNAPATFTVHADRESQLAIQSSL